MKMLKRVSVVALVLALLVSCIAFAVTAADNEYTVDNYETILEYYEEPVIFNYDFEDMTSGAKFAGAELQLVNTRQTATVQSDSEGNYLLLKNSPMPAFINAMYLNWNSVDGEGNAAPIDDFLFQTTVSGNTMVKLYLSSATIDKANVASDLALVSLYFGTATESEANVVKYHDGTSLVTLKNGEEDFVLVPDEKYEVKLVYTSSSEVYSLEVVKASDREVCAKVENIPTPTSSVANVRIGVDQTSAKVGATTNNCINIHEITAYGGTSFRDLADKQAQTEKAIIKMGELFADEGISIEDKLGIAIVVGKLDSVHGFTSENADVIAAVESVVKGGIILYADQLQICLDGASDELTYEERVENLEKYKDFLGFIPGNYDEILGEDNQAEIDRIADIIERFNAEVQFVADCKTHSDAFIAALAAADSSINDYTVLSSYYDAAEVHYAGIYKNYEGIEDAIKTFNSIKKKIEVFRTTVAPFVENAFIAADTTKSFGVRYEAYAIAVKNQLTEEEFPGVTTYAHEDGKTYNDAVTAFADVYSDIHVTAINGVEVDLYGMEALIALCDAYIANVKSADTALYLKAQKAFIEAADDNIAALEELISDYDGYPGFADAIELHDSINTEIANTVAAAKVYVDAVNELKAIQEGDDPLKGDALVVKLAEIDELAETGNVLGIEGVDVASANIYISDLSSALALELGYNDQYVSRVNSIDFDSMSTAELYSAISLAKSAEANEYVTAEYAEVKEAMETLAAAIEQYNAMISGTNAAFAEVNGVGADISSIPVGDSADTAAEFIKDLFR